MTQLLFQRVDGKPMASPVDLPRARRTRPRLSALVRRHADHSRPYIVSVHRRRDPLAVTDMTVRMRKTWAATTIGPRDTIIITYLPAAAGVAVRAAGAMAVRRGATVGLLVATVALAAVGQFWAIGAINGALGSLPEAL